MERRGRSGARGWGKRVAVACALALSLACPLATQVSAADPAGRAAPPPARAGMPVDVSDRVYLQVGLEVPTKYFYRGFLVEDSGWIAQPSLEMGANLFHGAGTFQDLDLAVGTWDTLLTGSAGDAQGGSDYAGWYEADFWAGLYVGFLDRFSLGLEYQAFTSPSQAFSVMQEWDLRLEIDDSEDWGEGLFDGFRPHLALGLETVGQSDLGDQEGLYLEIGLRPGLALGPARDAGWRLALPVTLGLSLQDFYEDAAGKDETFGYLDAGLELEVPLPFPQGAGAWTLTAGWHGILRGDHAREASGGPALDGYLLAGLTVRF